MKKVNSITEFCIFELVQVSSFTWNWQFWFLGPNSPKNGISGRKQKKWTYPLNSAYSNFFKYQVSPSTNSFYFLNQIFQKRYFRSKVKEVNITIEFCIFKLGWVHISWCYPNKHSPWWRRTEDVFSVTLFLSSKTSWRHLEDVLKT